MVNVFHLGGNCASIIPSTKGMRPTFNVYCSLDWLSDLRGSFSTRHVSFIGLDLISPMSCNCRDQICILVFLKLQVSFPQGGIFLMEVSNLIGAFLLQDIHIPLQGDHQSMIIKHLSRGIHHSCWAPILRDSYGRKSKHNGCMSLWLSFLG